MMTLRSVLAYGFLAAFALAVGHDVGREVLPALKHHAPGLIARLRGDILYHTAEKALIP